jgi:hypothetical protein
MLLDDDPRDLFHSDNANANATLDLMFLNIVNDRIKCDGLVIVGGTFAPHVQLPTKCFDKVIDGVPVFDRVDS